MASSRNKLRRSHEEHQPSSPNTALHYQNSDNYATTNSITTNYNDNVNNFDANNNQRSGSGNNNNKSTVPTLPEIKSSQAGRVPTSGFLQTLLADEQDDDGRMSDDVPQNSEQISNYDDDRHVPETASAKTDSNVHKLPAKDNVSAGRRVSREQDQTGSPRLRKSPAWELTQAEREQKEKTSKEQRRLSQQHGQQTPRRYSHGGRKYISSTVHIISDLDVKLTKDKNANTKLFDSNTNYSTGMNQNGQSEDNAYVRAADFNHVIHTSRPLGEDNSSVRDNETSTTLRETSDNPRLPKSAKADNINSSVSIQAQPFSSRPHHDNGSFVTKSGPEANEDGNSTTSSFVNGRRDFALNQWTTCRALDNDDDDDEEDEDQDDVFEDASVRSVLYYADDEAGGRSRASSLSSVGGGAARRDGGTTPGWIYDQASGRLSRMASTSNLVGGAGRKRRPLLLPPIMLPPIYTSVPTPLVLRDEVYFATTGSSSRCRPITDVEWDRLWDCRYLRIPNRSPTKRPIRV